uniref:Fe-S protein assembly co-chaperone HscB n=1 Tax=Ningiella ruwaisensis TaxID=2364274 RepID=UPI001F500A4C|nr:Fe-S protein assembly co-chaperone HscB [Ningiella ruwaisensis]
MITNYFDLFNLPEQFDIDLQKLKAQYQLLQKITHPDRFVNASDQEKRLYLQKNAQVNDAYSVLQSPVKRGEHLLSLRAYKLADEQQTMGDTDFLMQQMQLREQLAEAESSSDFAALESDINDLTTHYIEQVRSQLATQTDDANHQAAQTLTKLKFLLKLESEAQLRKEQVLEDD